MPGRPWMPTRWLAALAILSLAGCAGGDGGAGGPGSASTSQTSTPSSPGPAMDCDVDADLPVPPTWAAHGGQWATFVRPDLGHPQGFRGDGDADPGLSLLVDHATPASPDLDATVELLLVSGQHPDGAGLAFHWSGDSYNIVRYSPSEGGWHLFAVAGGERAKLDATVPPSAPAGPGWCTWTTLRVVAQGAVVQAFQDGELVLEATLPPGAATSGQAGPFVRGDSVALFAGYVRA